MSDPTYNLNTMTLNTDQERFLRVHDKLYKGNWRVGWVRELRGVAVKHGLKLFVPPVTSDPA